MLNEISLCPICYSNYDQASNAPRIISPCGHTICTECLRVLLKDKSTMKCPLDKVPFQSKRGLLRAYPINFAVNDLLEAPNGYNFCSAHKRPFRFICMTDRTKICDDCVIFGEHRDHSLKNMVDVKIEKANEQKLLEDIFAEYKSHRTNLISTLDQKQFKISMNVKTHFEELRSVLHRKESELITKINVFFEGNRETLNKIFVNQKDAGNEVFRKINERRNIFSQENFFDIMNEQISSVLVKCDASCFTGCQKKVEERFENICSSLNRLLEQADVSELESSLNDFITESLPLCVCKELPYDICKHPFDEVSNKKSYEQDLYPLDVRTYLAFELKDQVLRITFPKDPTEVHLVFDPKKWSNVQTIEYNVEYCGITRQDRDLLHHVWYSLEAVTNARVTFSAQATKDDHLMHISSALFPRVKGLHQVRVNLTDCKVTDSSVLDFFSCVLARMYGLKSLELILDSTIVTDKSISVLGENIIPLMKDLEIFKIDLYNVKGVTDKAIATLSKTMGKIKELSVQLQKTNVTDYGLCQFSEMLSKMTSLTKVEMYLGQLKVTDRGLLEVLFNLNTIDELILYAPNTEVTDESAQALIQMVTNGKVQKLSVGLSNTKVCAEVLEQLQEIMANLKKTKQNQYLVIRGCL